MRIVKTILIVLGILSIFFNAIAYFQGLRPFTDDPAAGMADRIAYFIGTNAFFIFGGLLLFISWLLNRRIKRKENKKMVDSLFNE